MINATILVVFMVASAASSSAQYYLACRGKEQVLIDNKIVFQMEEGTDYQVVGISLYGGFLIRTGYGNADYKGNRFRVLPGGSSSSVAVGLRNVKKGIMEHWEENKMGWRSQSWYSSYWSGQVITLQTLNQCYAAFQWYEDGNPVRTTVQKIGKLEANKPFTLQLRVPVREDQRDGKYSFHVWSGGYELKTVELAESQGKW